MLTNDKDIEGARNSMGLDPNSGPYSKQKYKPFLQQTQTKSQNPGYAAAIISSLTHLYLHFTCMALGGGSWLSFILTSHLPTYPIITLFLVFCATALFGY